MVKKVGAREIISLAHYMSTEEHLGENIEVAWAILGADRVCEAFRFRDRLINEALTITKPSTRDAFIWAWFRASRAKRRLPPPTLTIKQYQAYARVKYN